ncbi:MAG TPA: class I SAM-dependent methyltransferase [Ferruginibacter sp.]|nr:class I SAM-dependent methyltransferase [Ferruginibacter sp.]
MYTRFQLAKKYLHYYFTASNGKGHGVHSPFVYDFIRNVLKDKKKYKCYEQIEGSRKNLLANNTVIEVEDFGAGSAVIKTNQRVVKDIAASSLKQKKYAQLLFRIVQYYKTETIIELGTSFGITTAYLASTNSKVFTCEGAKNIAAIAQQHFNSLGLKNIELVQGDFGQTLQPLFAQLNKIDLAFIDGNHRKEPTLGYFNQLLNHSTNATILIFDDIHWSAEMEAAWQEIQSHPAVTLTIDLFFIGIVLINNDFKVKQHFSVAY